MAKTRTTVKGQVFKTLDQRLELGGTTEYGAIEHMSLYNVDNFVNDFRANNAHLISYPFKNSTVNRAVEQWLKSKISA